MHTYTYTHTHTHTHTHTGATSPLSADPSDAYSPVRNNSITKCKKSVTTV
jgi:hypothetical protein